LRKVANSQADKQTNQQRRKHILLGGGNDQKIPEGMDGLLAYTLYNTLYVRLMNL